MNTYDFTNLSFNEFESLIKDILEIYLGLPLERFKDGKDGGVDIRYSQNKKDEIFIQCKNYSNWSDLQRKLIIESKKVLVSKKSIKRYILVTGLPLSAANKSAILKIFGNIILDTRDIIGSEDLNDILSKEDYKEIEKKHIKLRFSSVNILEHILHSAVHNRSDFFKEDVKKTVKYYAVNQSLIEGIHKAKKNNVIIISGEPGIGKTTLAKMISYYFSQNYSLYDISDDLNDFDVIYKNNQKQLFYFDDFLGNNFLKQDINASKIAKIIETIKKSKKHKLVITTREYVLNQGIDKYEKLENTLREKDKYVLDLGKYSSKVKAMIFYHHLFFSGIDQEYIDNIVYNNNYRGIVFHKNYNPRIIEWICNLSMIEENKVKPSEYASFCKSFLDDPSKIWKKSFENISILSRNIIIVVFLNHHRKLAHADLLCELKCFMDFSERELKTSLKEIEGTFIKIDENRKISVQNPSITDFLINYLEEDDLFKFIDKTPYLHYLLSENLRYIIDKRKRLVLSGKIKLRLQTKEIYSLNFVSGNVQTDNIYHYVLKPSKANVFYEISKYYNWENRESYYMPDILTISNSYDIFYIVYILLHIGRNISYNYKLVVKESLNYIDEYDTLKWILRLREIDEESFDKVLSSTYDSDDIVDKISDGFMDELQGVDSGDRNEGLVERYTEYLKEIESKLDLTLDEVNEYLVSTEDTVSYNLRRIAEDYDDDDRNDDEKLSEIGSIDDLFSTLAK